MYSRSYKQEVEGLTIPESYGGVAFREPETEPEREEMPKGLARSADIPFTSPEPPDPKLTAKAEETVRTDAPVKEGGFFASIMEKIPFKSVFS